MTTLTRRRLLTAAGLTAAGLALPKVPGFAADREAIGIAGDPNGEGYWIVFRNGRVEAAGSAGSVGGARPGRRPAAAITAHAGGSGFWRVDTAGTVTAHGRAPSLYSAWGGGDDLGRIAGIAADSRGGGYWIATADGAVLPYGRSRDSDLMFVAAGVRDIAAHPREPGYWILDDAGNVQPFGAANRYGSPDREARAIAAHPRGRGYWTVTRGGHVEAFGDAEHHGDARDRGLTIVGIAAHASGYGYWLLAKSGRVLSFASKPPQPDPTGPVGDVNVVTVEGIVVARSISRPVGRLIRAARADGVQLGGWGYRSHARQIELRKQHCGTSHYDIYEKPSSQCNPPTARPGSSMHERGLAIDFYRKGAGGSALSISSGTKAFRWLKNNAARYGLYNLPSEPWHWSTNGR